MLSGLRNFFLAFIGALIVWGLCAYFLIDYFAGMDLPDEDKEPATDIHGEIIPPEEDPHEIEMSEFYAFTALIIGIDNGDSQDPHIEEEEDKIRSHRNKLSGIKINFCDEWNRKITDLKRTLEDAKKELTSIHKKVVLRPSNGGLSKNDGLTKYEDISKHTNAVYGEHIQCVQSQCSKEYKEYDDYCNELKKLFR